MKITPLLILLSTGLSEHRESSHDDRFGARQCLALAVFAEARGESWLGQAAIAQTVINRARAGAGDVCSVIEAPGQYHGVERWPYPRQPWDIDERAWMVAQQVADAVIEGDYVVSPPACAGATFFYRKGTRPGSWARDLEVVCEIGGHVFLGAP